MRVYTATAKTVDNDPHTEGTRNATAAILFFFTLPTKHNIIICTYV